MRKALIYRQTRIYYVVILIVLFIIPTGLLGQRGDNINQEVLTYVRPFTGSGIALSTTWYNHYQDDQPDLKAYKGQRKAIERQVYKKKHRTKAYEYAFELVFHNLSTLSVDRFEKEVEIQIRALNRDYNQLPKLSKNHPYANIIEAPGFTFTLANKGIVGHSEHIWRDWDSVKFNKTGGSNSFPPHKYINIWVADIPDEIGSYAQYPEGQAVTDGIVIDIDYFGSGHPIYDEGKTLTTLIAQYFGLKSLYNYGNCVDDMVLDTPKHHEPLRTALPHVFTSPCDNQPLMTDNFLSHAPDSERKYFTQGQVSRMKQIIDNSVSRFSLLNTQKSAE